MSFIVDFKSTPHTHPDHLSEQPLTPPATPPPPPSLTPVLQTSEEDVRQVFRKYKRRKALGPGGVTPACLKPCADHLAPIFTQIFTDHWSSCFKHSSIIPV